MLKFEWSFDSKWQYEEACMLMESSAVIWVLLHLSIFHLTASGHIGKRIMLNTRRVSLLRGVPWGTLKTHFELNNPGSKLGVSQRGLGCEIFSVLFFFFFSPSTFTLQTPPRPLPISLLVLCEQVCGAFSLSPDVVWAVGYFQLFLVGRSWKLFICLFQLYLVQNGYPWKNVSPLHKHATQTLGRMPLVLLIGVLFLWLEGV